MVLTVWIVALILYLVFRLWYDGLKQPLTKEELEHFTKILQERADEFTEDELATMGRFMEDDDGEEFIMVNLVEFNDSPVMHPETGEGVRAPDLLTEYTKPFMASILRSACHPVIAGRGVGGYLDAWNTPPDPGWHMAGLVRYRSRRDVLRLSFGNPEFQGIHKYKIAAMKQTYAFPMQKHVALYASPRLTVALVLALSAALMQIAIG